MALPSDADAVPQETQLAASGGWRFLAMGGVPLIARAKGGPADQLRSAFLGFFLPRLSVSAPLSAYALEMGRQWGARLDGYPAVFLRTAPNAFAPFNAFAAPSTFAGPRDFAPSHPFAAPNPFAAPSIFAGPLATTSELVAAMAVLMRVGLVVVKGISQKAITRSDLRVSFMGSRSIRGEEGSQPGLYWPGNDASGVTIDPGYDMGGRVPDQVIADLTAVGVPAGAAAKAAEGATALGSDAGAFAAQNKNVVVLTHAQAAQLFYRVVPRYERLVLGNLPRSLRPRLFQHEFDALASLAWNTSRYGRYACNDDVRRLDLVRAVTDWMSLTGGGPGIHGRRVRETHLFEKAIYTIQPLPPSKPSTPSGLLATGGERV